MCLIMIIFSRLLHQAATMHTLMCITLALARVFVNLKFTLLYILNTCFPPCSLAPTPCSKHLLVLFDCESTGLNIYHDHILEIAAKVVNVAVSQPIYSSLVRTSHKSLQKVSFYPMCMLTQQNARYLCA